jgi:predicted AlkP superfamily pyrophosphatase or phosphodiesterase
MVWDGLRPDSVDDVNTPTLAALGRSGVSFQDNHATYPTFTMMNAASFATGGFPGTTGFYGNTLWAPGASGKDANNGSPDFNQPAFTEDFNILQDLDRYYNHQLLVVNTLFQQAQAKGLRTAAVGKGGPAFLQDYKKGGVILDEKMAYPLSLVEEIRAANLDVPLRTNIAYGANQVDEQDPVRVATVRDAGVDEAKRDGGAGAAKRGAGDATKRGAGDASKRDAGVDAAPPVIPNAPDPTLQLVANQVPKAVLTDKSTSDPTVDDKALDPRNGSQYGKQDAYMMQVYVKVILPLHKPDISVIWFRNPDSEEHNYGPGSADYKNALKSQDALLKDLLDALDADKGEYPYDVIVVSDHAHSTVSGPLAMFPLRAIVKDPKPAPAAGPGTVIPGNTVGDRAENGVSVSGDVRLADMLTAAQIPVKSNDPSQPDSLLKAYDGAGCATDFVMSGIKADGTHLIAPKVGDSAICNGQKYATPAYVVPPVLDNSSVVIAANGGSDYVYVPGHSPAVVKSVVAFLQQHEQFGAIFVSSAYGRIRGTLPLKDIKVEDAAGRSPDLVVSYAWDDRTVIEGMPGIEFESALGNRGMHGSFSPIDVHNTLFALGADFKKGFRDLLPTGNVDVAPTVAWLFGLDLTHADGRPLFEALVGGLDPDKDLANAGLGKPMATTASSDETEGLDMTSPLLVPDGKKKYHVELTTKTLRFACGLERTYFDKAEGVRR